LSNSLRLAKQLAKEGPKNAAEMQPLNVKVSSPVMDTRGNTRGRLARRRLTPDNSPFSSPAGSQENLDLDPSVLQAEALRRAAVHIHT